MTPGTILHDSQFLCHDKTENNKLLVVLNDGSAGFYVLVKTTSKAKKMNSSPGCHPKDFFRNFYIPKGNAGFLENTWVMLNEFYEADYNQLFERKLAGHLAAKGTLPEDVFKSLLICAKDSLDISQAQERILDDTLTALVLL